MITRCQSIAPTAPDFFSSERFSDQIIKSGDMFFLWDKVDRSQDGSVRPPWFAAHKAANIW